MLLSYVTAFLLASMPQAIALAMPVEQSLMTSRLPIITKLDPQTISDAMNIVQFARTGYCSQDVISSWTCGDACTTVAPVVVETYGGDGSDAPDYHVVYWPQKLALIVVHEGTVATSVKSLDIDLHVKQVTLNSTHFPGSTSEMKVHRGFMVAQARSAQPILASIQKALSAGVVVANGTTEIPQRVIVTGYSLGAAVAVLDATFLRGHLPTTIPVYQMSVGTPIVGNAAFAAYVNQVLDPPATYHVRLVNHHDIVPRVPEPIFHGWKQSGVEYNLAKDGSTWWNCGLQSNYGKDPRCSGGFVFADGSFDDHKNLGSISMIYACAAT